MITRSGDITIGLTQTPLSMGGSGGGWSRSSSTQGGGGSSGRGGGTAGDDCARVGGKAPLSSPVPNVVNALSVGQKLDIEARQGRVFVMHQGSPAGVLLAGWADRLVECVEAGSSYEATVTELTGGLCEVLVRHVG